LLVSSFLALPLSVARCSSSGGSPGIAPDGDGGTTNETGSVDGPVTPVVPGECGTEKMCLDVAIPPETADYGVVVFWFQLDDDGPDPPFEIAYEGQVAANATRIEIATSAVKAPTDERNLLCERAGDDENVSPCLSDPKVGYALVVAYRDVDTDKKFGAPDRIVGYGNAIFGYSAQAYPPGTAPTYPAQWDGLWPRGIEAGVRIYQVERRDGGGFDRPVPSSAGTVNTLGTRGPNLT
jgi:hypothetical protein